VNFHVEQWYTCGLDYGIVEVYLNGKKVDEWDGYTPSVVRRKTDFEATFKNGENALTFVIERKNDASTGFLGGLDCYRLTPEQ